MNVSREKTKYMTLKSFSSIEPFTTNSLDPLRYIFSRSFQTFEFLFLSFYSSQKLTQDFVCGAFFELAFFPTVITIKLTDTFETHDMGLSFSFIHRHWPHTDSSSFGWRYQRKIDNLQIVHYNLTLNIYLTFSLLL